MLWSSLCFRLTSRVTRVSTTWGPTLSRAQAPWPGPSAAASASLECEWILLVSHFSWFKIVYFIQMHPLCPCPLLHDSVQGNRALLLKLWHSAREVQRLEGEGGLLRSSLFSHITCSWSWLYNTALTLITSTRLRKWFVNTPSWYQVLIYICWKSIFFIFI